MFDSIKTGIYVNRSIAYVVLNETQIAATRFWKLNRISDGSGK
jgi:hypothetical protein